MPLEVRQMVVKSSVAQRSTGDVGAGDSPSADGTRGADALRRELLEACRRLVREARDERKER